MRLGDLTVHVFADTTFRLDGGAIFGVVPRVLWERVKPPDEKNRILMTSHCLLVESGDRLVLVDAGLGDKLDAKEREIFDVPDGEARLPDRLAEAGCRVEEVTDVVLTHLHFDHCGWSTRREGDRWAPTFPRARYWIQRDELHHARHPNVRDRVSYDSRNFEPLLDEGSVELFDEEAEPAPGIRAVRAPGHTRGMSIVLLDGGDSAKGVFLADLVPTAAHLSTPWVMGYDLFPVETMESKERWLPRAAREGWVCFLQHDPEMPGARLVEEGSGRYRAEPLDPELLD
ncbi:MAG: MBL fold metallo-hydrolase [Thermoanaerobaculia bacterium]|nr:MBL fold metallo-hydrolase [Thermoanaerobaculia bacterium]